MQWWKQACVLLKAAVGLRCFRGGCWCVMMLVGSKGGGGRGVVWLFILCLVFFAESLSCPGTPLVPVFRVLSPGYRRLCT
jgi:hypothetical protein